ncbi:unnamed protein product [Cylicocyclus nassatus]|uniref:Uncharacterized protein n=1 Tax=Cylicocyclus nassatus TaxID=53992 RepID=A0AA36DTR0_CYLNA|nr:unnamed protein product [Cylicocyclus nassatus]
MVGRTGLAVAKALLTRPCRKLKVLAEECEAAKESLNDEVEDGIQSKAIELEEMTKTSLERKNARTFNTTALSMGNGMGNVEITWPKSPAVPDSTFAANYKSNYLINSLQDDARELTRRFIVAEDNHDEAVAMLHRKYGDKKDLLKSFSFVSNKFVLIIRERSLNVGY